METAKYSVTEVSQMLNRSLSTVSGWINELSIDWTLGPKRSKLVDASALPRLREHAEKRKPQNTVWLQAQKRAQSTPATAIHSPAV